MSFRKLPRVDIVYLCALAFLAGFVDSVVGGGGLVQLPGLFILLPKPLTESIPTVFGTNKLASILGTSVALAQYARRVSIHWATILPAAAAAFCFSFLGGWVVTRVSGSNGFKPILLILLIAVAVYTFWRKDFGSLHAPRLTPRGERAAGLLIGAGIGFYDGFFGPGTGSFLIFIFIGLFGFDFLTASASAKVINVATNLSVVLYFGATDHILYRFAVPMGVSNILGALLGSRLAILKGNAFVRGFFMIVVSVMIARFGWDVLTSK